MAIFTLSPSVNVTEINANTTTPASATSFGGNVGEFRWGPVLERFSVSDENELVFKVGEPNDSQYSGFLSCANFLQYGSNLTIVRVVGALARNSDDGGTNVLIKNKDDYDNQYSGLTQSFYGKYAGAIGNDLVVHYSNATDFPSWAYTTDFDYAPVEANGEVHLVVLLDGVIVEKMTVSVLPGAVDYESNNIFMPDYLKSLSNYIYSGPVAIAGGDTDLIALSDSGSFTLSGGVDTKAVAADYLIGWDLFANPIELDINLIFAGSAVDTADNTLINSTDSRTIQAYMVNSIASVRNDAVAFTSVSRNEVVSVSSSSVAVTNAKTWRSSFNVNSSYGTLVGNYKYQYDKYSRKYRWVSLDADIAGLCVYTDNVRDPWWSPSGLNRGQIKGVTKLAYSTTQAQNDLLYKDSINPVISFPGEGTVLWGDKTLLSVPSVFDRIGTRRLFIVLEKSISSSAKSFIGEFNDAFTRSQFINIVEPFLRLVQGRRGIEEFRVICDQTNNTTAIINAKGFVGDIYIKPTSSINYINLNFVATPSGISFEEIIG